MAAMAVGALGGVGIAQAVDLAVVGGLVGLVGILVAIAATGSDRQLGLVGRTADDVVGGVAIGADRRLEILFLGFPAVCRRRPVFQMVRVTGLAAHRGHGEVPVLALLRAARRHVKGVHVVAIAADGHLLGRLVLVRLGVEGLPVGRDILGDDAQPRLLDGLVVLFRSFPQVQVALRALDFRCTGHLLVGGNAIDDFPVAGDALHLGMHALAIFVRIDCLQRALGAIRGGYFELVLLAIVAGLAGRVVEFLRDRSRVLAGCRNDPVAAQGSGRTDRGCCKPCCKLVVAGRAALVGVGNRHGLAGFHALDALVVLARHVIEVGRDVVHPVVLAVLAIQALAQAGAGLHGLGVVAVGTGDLVRRHVHLVFSITCLPSCRCGSCGTGAGRGLEWASAFIWWANFGLAMGVVTVGTGHQVVAVAVLGRLDEVGVLLVVGLGMQSVRPVVLRGRILRVVYWLRKVLRLVPGNIILLSALTGWSFFRLPWGRLWHWPQIIDGAFRRQLVGADDAGRIRALPSPLRGPNRDRGRFRSPC
jgi:hypothetical protein